MQRMTRTLARSFAALVLLLAASAPFVSAQQQNPAASADPLLHAMGVELERSKASLKLENVAAPYYIEYRVLDLDEYDAEAAYGSLRNKVRTRLRFLRVAVRIGDYKQDSYRGGQGEGAISLIPFDDDLIAMRHQIWEATDRAYKAAAQELTAKQAQLKQYTAPEQPVWRWAFKLIESAQRRRRAVNAPQPRRARPCRRPIREGQTRRTTHRPRS